MVTWQPSAEARKILTFIGNYVGEYGYSPSIRDVMKGTGLASTSSVAWHIQQLRVHDFLERAAFKHSRSLMVTAKAQPACPTCGHAWSMESKVTDRG